MFGWTAKTSPDYTELQKDGTSIAGMLALRPDQKTPGWLIYFQVANVDGKVDQAQKLGAKLLVPPMDIPGSGRFAVLADPQGASFALYGAAAT